MKKILLLNISVLVLVFCAYSQSVSITPEHSSGTCSDYIVTFDGVASAVATSFNFNGGSVPPDWSTSPYTISSTFCPGQNSPDNSSYFWATKLQSGVVYSGKRFVQTNAVNVAGGGFIKFYIRYGGDEGTGCEDPDGSSEEVELAYSTNGTDWVIIFDDWDTDGSKSAPWYDWYWNDIAIPEGAKTSSTIFRWYQPSNSGEDWDNWGLEDVTIGTNISPVSYKWFVNGSEVATTENLTYTFPTANAYTIKYDVLFSDGITRSATTTYEVLSNQTPSLNAISDITVPMNSGQQSVGLSGIDDGDCVAQGLSLSTATANASLISTPTYSYSSPNSTGTLYFTPASNQVGNVQLTATITDNAANSYGSALSISRNFNVYVNDYPTTPGAFTQPTGDKLNIDDLYDIAWGASTDQTAPVSYNLQYMLNGGSWTTIDNGILTNSYTNWGGHQNISLVGRTVQFRVMSYDGTYPSGYTYSSTYDITDNEPPVANDITYKRFYTDSQKVFSVNAANGVLSNDTDPDNDTPLYVADPRNNVSLSYGYLTLNADGSFTYTSDDGEKDINDTFTYYANDGQENSVSPATVTIEILTPRFTNANGTEIFTDPANWNCGYVPNIESLNIIIAAGTQLQVDQDYTCKNLQFETGASFTCINGHTLTINGDVLNCHGGVVIDIASPVIISTSIIINNL